MIDVATAASAVVTLQGVILSGGAFQPERRACPEPHGEGISQTTELWAREIPPLAGENASVRDDSALRVARFHGASNREEKIQINSRKIFQTQRLSPPPPIPTRAKYCKRTTYTQNIPEQGLSRPNSPPHAVAPLRRTSTMHISTFGLYADHSEASVMLVTSSANDAVW